jgi:hypothetical protein
MMEIRELVIELLVKLWYRGSLVVSDFSDNVVAENRTGCGASDSQVQEIHEEFESYFKGAEITGRYRDSVGSDVDAKDYELVIAIDNSVMLGEYSEGVDTACGQKAQFTICLFNSYKDLLKAIIQKI